MAEISDLSKALDALGADASEEIISHLIEYMDGVLRWNQKVNLTAVRERGEFIEKHLIDSLIPLAFDEWKRAGSVIDIGTGGGFPGVPLAAVSADKKFVLLDSLAKRLKIVKELCADIGIKNCDVLHGRAEEAAHKREYRERFDVCVARAVGQLSLLSEYCLPFVRVGGCFMAYKSGDVSRETSEAQKAITVLGGRVDAIRRYGDVCPALPCDTEHCIVVIKKIKSTADRFPRKAGTPSKKPIR